jgi:hypothetical protein
MARPADEGPPAGDDWRSPSAEWRRHWRDRDAPAEPPPADPAEGELRFGPGSGHLAGLRRAGKGTRRKLFWALGVALGLCGVVLVVLYSLPADRWGNVVHVGGLEVYYGRGVHESEALALARFLREQGVAEGTPATARLSRTEEGYGLYLFVEPVSLDDPDALAELQDLRERVSSEVFGGRTVVLYLCDRGVGQTALGQLKEPLVRKVLR